MMAKLYRRNALTPPWLEPSPQRGLQRSKRRRCTAPSRCQTQVLGAPPASCA